MTADYNERALLFCLYFFFFFVFVVIIVIFVTIVRDFGMFNFVIVLLVA